MPIVPVFTSAGNFHEELAVEIAVEPRNENVDVAYDFQNIEIFFQSFRADGEVSERTDFIKMLT